MAMNSGTPGQGIRNVVDAAMQDDGFRDWVFGGPGSCSHCWGTGTVYGDVCSRCNGFGREPDDDGGK